MNKTQNSLVINLSRQYNCIVRSFLVASIIFILIARFILIGRLNINWDEFFFLSRIYQAHRGEALPIFQTFHVWLFQWLPSWQSDEISQILVGRTITALLSFFSVLLIYYIAKKFASSIAALAAVWVYLLLSDVIEHGSSFRYDPFLNLLLITQVALICSLVNRTRIAVLCGVLSGFAFVLSIKFVLFIPLIAVVLFLSIENLIKRSQAILLFFTAAALTAFTLLVFHRYLLSPQQTEGLALSFRELLTSFLAINTINQRLPFVINSIRSNPISWALILSGLCLALMRFFRCRENSKTSYLTLLLFASPLFFLLFYRGANPYFFPLALILPAILSALTIDVLLNQDLLDKSFYLRIIPVGLIFVGMSFSWQTFNELKHDRLSNQRKLVSIIHQLFPKPLPYYDRCGMIPSFPRRGSFISSWLQERFRSRNEGLVSTTLEKTPPIFIIANHPGLQRALKTKYPIDSQQFFEPQDVQFFRDNYTHFWGPLYLAGKEYELLDSGNKVLKLLVEGDYLLDADTPVLINEQKVNSGESIRLSPGEVNVQKIMPQAVKVRLRWGAGLKAPSEKPIDEAIFYGF